MASSFGKMKPYSIEMAGIVMIPAMPYHYEIR